MAELLAGERMTVRDLSQMLGISEREVIPHLEHVERTAAGQGRKLVITPSSCLACAFVFEARHRFRKPSRCPSCRSERISPPAFELS